VVVTGFLFDTISTVAEHLFGRQFEDLPQSKDNYYKQHYYHRSVMREYDIIAQVADPYPSGGTLEDAYSRLYICDQPVADKAGKLPPDEIHIHAY
jgi:hypothetical protein